MSSMQAELRRMVAEIPGEPDGQTVVRVGPRTIHQYWHLLAPSFRGILLVPHRRVGEAGTSWTWHESDAGGVLTSAELESVRRRLAVSYELFFESCDHDAPLNDDGGIPFELRLAIEDVVNALKACDDGRLADYVCRTEAGLFVHSWGVTPPARPRQVTDAGVSDDAAASSVRDKAANRNQSANTQAPASRRRRRWLVVLVALLLLGFAVGGARWFWQRGRPPAASPMASAAPGAASRSSGEAAGAGPAGTVMAAGQVGSAGKPATSPQTVPDSDLRAMRTGALPTPVTTKASATARQSTSALPSTTWRSSDRAAVAEPPRGLEASRGPRATVDASADGARSIRDVASVAGGEAASPSDALAAGAGASASRATAEPLASSARDAQASKDPRAISGRPANPPPTLPPNRRNQGMPSSAPGAGPSGVPSMPGEVGERDDARSSPDSPSSSATAAKTAIASSPTGALVSPAGDGAKGAAPTSALASAGPSGAVAAAASDSRAANVKTDNASDDGSRGGDADSSGSPGDTAGGDDAAASHDVPAPLADGLAPTVGLGETGADQVPSEASAGGDPRETDGSLVSEKFGIALPDSGEPSEAPPGWSARRTEVTISVPQLRLLRDAILPTEPRPAGRDDTEAIARLREQLWREREAQIPSALARPGVWHGCAIELPPGAGGGERRWTSRGDGRSVTATIEGTHAELAWPVEGFLKPAVFVLHDSTGAALAQVEMKAAGELVIRGAPSLQVWPWIAIDGPALEMKRFRWRGRGDVSRPPVEGRQRIGAASVGAAKSGAAVETVVFEDAVSGWALFIEITQISDNALSVTER